MHDNNPQRELQIRFGLTLHPAMNCSPPDVMGKAVAIAIRRLPLAELRVTRHQLIGFATIPRDATLDAFEARIEELRRELERELDVGSFTVT